ncbi:MAG: hypothetical protein OEM00_09425 [Burkholderiaceae bacterium]|nr:hypothetical protein [Burkholderiaceae bacterium]
MRRTRYFLLCLAYAALPAVAAPPEERNCTEAIAEAQKALREMPAEKLRDKARLQQMKEKQDKLIADNRSKGVSECQTWGQVMGEAFKQ